MAKVYDHEELNDAETKPSSPKTGLSTSTSGGKVAYSSDGKKQSGSSVLSTGTSAGAVNYDTSDNIPQAESSLYNRAASTQTQPGRLKFRNLLSTNPRKVAFGGGITTLIISTAFFLIASGPLEFVHLSQTLQRNFFGSNHTVQIRNKGLLRFARTGNIEETRLGLLGSKVYNRTLSQLKDQGMEFTDKNIRGVPEKFTIDTNKNDNYKDLSPAAREDAIIRDFNITNPRIITETGHLGSGVFQIDLSNTTLKGIDFIKATAKTAIGSLGNGKIETGLSTRYVKVAWDLPGLFSPLQKLKSAALNRLVSGVNPKQAADEAETARTTSEVETVVDTPEILTAKDKLKNAFDENQSNINRILFVQAGICALRAAANDAVKLNRGLIVLPATVQAADKVALGSQVQSGQNFDDTQLGAVKDSFQNDKGQTIWSARALKATEGDAAPTGPDLPVDYAQAFSGRTTADEIRNEIQFKVLGVSVTGIACSPVGLAAGLITGIVAIISSIPDDGASALGYAAWAAEQAGSAIAVGGLFYMFQSHLTDLLQDKALTPAVLSGPLGGNLMAYGARELSNVQARSMGGAALDNTQKSVLSQEDEQQYQQEFQSESVAKKLFDTYDSRSAISKIIDNVSPSVTENVSNVASFFTNFIGSAGHTFSMLFPHASASAAAYDWGFPKYGIPQGLAEDSNYEDPYANGDAVAQMLDQKGCASDSTCTWRDRAMRCFGVDINKDSGQWEVVAQKDVNPDSDEYKDGNCTDTSDSWSRVRLFVLDSRLMDTIACHQATDEQSCTNLAAD